MMAGDLVAAEHFALEAMGAPAPVVSIRRMAAHHLARILELAGRHDEALQHAHATAGDDYVGIVRSRGARSTTTSTALDAPGPSVPAVDDTVNGAIAPEIDQLSGWPPVFVRVTLALVALVPKSICPVDTTRLPGAGAGTGVAGTGTAGGGAGGFGVVVDTTGSVDGTAAEPVASIDGIVVGAIVVTTAGVSTIVASSAVVDPGLTGSELGPAVAGGSVL